MRHFQEKTSQRVKTSQRMKSIRDMKISLMMKTLLFLLLVVAGLGQSGFDDEGTRITCWSHISMKLPNSLTCRVTDEEDGTIESMTMCFSDIDLGRVRCLPAVGATLTSSDLHPLALFNVTVYLKNAAPIWMTVDLKKIVKPRTPVVLNVTQNQETNQVIIHIGTPYQEDYLSVQYQCFQVFLWTGGSKTVQNVSSSDSLAVNLEHLLADAQYSVKVRAIPLGSSLQGIWSDWSDAYRFSTPARQSHIPPEWWSVPVCVVLSLILVLGIFLFWKQKIFRIMWPRIPKPPLVDIRTSTRGLLLHFTPENFSPLMLEKYNSTTYSSGCDSSSSGSVNKEQLNVSSPKKQNPPGPGDDLSPGVEGAEVSGASSKEDTYVTMSCFHQVQQKEPEPSDLQQVRASAEVFISDLL